MNECFYPINKSQLISFTVIEKIVLKEIVLEVIKWSAGVKEQQFKLKNIDNSSVWFGSKMPSVYFHLEFAYLAARMEALNLESTRFYSISGNMPAF